MKLWLVAALVVASACGSSSSATAEPALIVGAKSCQAGEAQDLTFSGALTGHLACSIAEPACHRTHGPQSPGVTVSLLGMSGAKPVALRIAFGRDHVGTFTATAIGDEPALDQQGVTLSGLGSWTSQGDAGTLTILEEVSPTLQGQGKVAGSMDVKLTSGASTAEVKGSWICIKTLAGGDGWSSA